jgi:hypothetical protein
MEVNITCDDIDLKEPRSRVRAIAAVARMICEEIGEDSADGATMMLLTAAAWIVLDHATDKTKAPDILADALGNAIIAAKDWSRNEFAS